MAVIQWHTSQIVWYIRPCVIGLWRIEWLWPKGKNKECIHAHIRKINYHSELTITQKNKIIGKLIY